MAALHARLADIARHLRDPHHTPRPPGLPARPVAVYAGLLFENLAGFLDACLPVSRSVLGEARWRRLIRTFYRDWPCRSPWFRDIPREFAAYLEARAAHLRVPRWLPALAHYEWADLAVATMAAAAPACDPDGDLLRTSVVVNPAMLNLAYAWPVHRIGPDFRPSRPEPSHLAVFRDRDERVRFSLLTPASARLLAILAESGATGAEAIARLAAEWAYPDPAALQAHGGAILAEMRRLGLVLGTA